MQLTERVALITGGNRGIGLSIAEAFVAAGTCVVITGRDRPALLAAAKRLSARSDTAVDYFSADVRDAAAIEEMVADTVARHGPDRHPLQ